MINGLSDKYRPPRNTRLLNDTGSRYILDGGDCDRCINEHTI